MAQKATVDFTGFRPIESAAGFPQTGFFAAVTSKLKLPVPSADEENRSKKA
jgi:hypothetical protein